MDPRSIPTKTEPSSPPDYAIDAERWGEAQAHEMAFWQREGVFDNELRRVETRYGPVLAEIDRGLAPDARILDVGCGPTAAARLFSKGEKVFLDPLMRAYERRWPDRMPEGLRLAGSGESLPFGDGTFDVVVSFNALDHMRRPTDVLAEIRRVLKPSGTLVLGVFCHPPAFAYGRSVIERVLPALKDTPHPFSFTRAAIERLLERYFVVEEARCVHRKSGVFSRWHRTDWVFRCRTGNVPGSARG